MSKLLFELTKDSQKGHYIPDCQVSTCEAEYFVPAKYLRKTKIRIPQLSEPEVMRHFVELSNKNHHVDKGFYPLGSCTMKYNPKINEKLSRLSGISDLHPLQPEQLSQSGLQIMYELSDCLCKISGMEAVSLQPAAGAHGELTGLKVIRAYHESKGSPRTTVLIPDSAHGTNPASVTITGYQSLQVRSNELGLIDLDDLTAKMNENTAAIMITNPNTLGLFETNLKEIISKAHNVGALVYMDGANLNALMGIIRPGDIEFDVLHFNLHKTFSTPHGGGGPGAGPIGVSSRLVDFLPVPIIGKKNSTYYLNYNRPRSIGKISTYFGNFGVMVRAYVYIRMLGAEGLRRVSENAIINANYLKSKLEKYYLLPYKSPVMHEFVLSGENHKSQGVKTLDIAKRLLDFGFHAPTIYFPLIVKEAMMIEPTETESKQTLDQFIATMVQIAKEIKVNPEIVTKAPLTTEISRLDDVKAIKEPNLKYNFNAV